MSISVFFSYAAEDSGIATRVYEDFARSRHPLRLWCYQKNSRYGADFRREYLGQIDAANRFLLFDSRHARASKYVAEEVVYWKRQGSGDLTLCLLEQEGEWRSSELFAGQNYIVYIDFTRYESGIRALCSDYGLTYHPRFIEPRDLEFDEELREAGVDFELATRQEILGRYEDFSRSSSAEPTVAEAHLVSLIEKYLTGTDLGVVTPLLALGAIRMQRGRAEAALDAFRAMTTRAPDDPRGWAGCGAALFKLARYAEAAENYAASLARIMAADNPSHREHVIDVVHNRAIALYSDGRLLEALRALMELDGEDRNQPEVRLLHARIMLANDDVPAAKLEGRRLLDRLDQGAGLMPESAVDLVEFARDLGESAWEQAALEHGLTHYPNDPGLMRAAAVFYVERGDYERACKFYELLCDLAPGEVRYLAEFALLLKQLGDLERAAIIAERCLEVYIPPADTAYFIGLAGHLLGRDELAEHLYRLSKRDPLLRAWPSYDGLL